jgi:hypothetical protein
LPDRHRRIAVLQRTTCRLQASEKEDPMTTLETLSIVFAVYAVVFLAHRATHASH